MSHNRKSRAGETLTGIALGLALLLTATALALALLHSCDLLYRIDLKAFNLPRRTGLSEEVILRNYHAMMRFLSPFSTAPFALPDLTWSAEGAIHFEDCRRLFRLFYLLGAAGLALTVWLRRRQGKAGFSRRTLLTAAATLAGALLIALAALLIDPARAFILFHELLFTNDYWVFSAARDPIILLLPEPFFYHCGAVFALFWGLTLAALLLLSRNKKGT
ncbi:MAG: TIGR01906 family membrane protein [Clostridia bacterium]|nr:TIGR01906 family membrane protein [Clostridia bacterium]